MAVAIVGCLGFAMTRAVAGEPIAATDGEQAGVRLEVSELKRGSGDTLMLKLVLVNEGDEPVEFSSHRFGDVKQGSDYHAIGGVTLVDAANKKKYLVIRDSEGMCLCSRELKPLAPGGRIALWAKFAAPPEGVDKLEVLMPHFIPMEEIPISP